MNSMTTEERFHAKVRVDEETDCWVWQAAVRGNGYGGFWDGRGLTYAHRFAFERFKEPISEGLEIDHLCRNRLCVNPDHLEAVTRRENQLRGDTFAAANARKTHCKHGHPFDQENTLLIPHGRQCRKCSARRVREARARAAAA